MNDLEKKRENPYVGSRYASDVSLMAVISVYLQPSCFRMFPFSRLFLTFYVNLPLCGIV